MTIKKSTSKYSEFTVTNIFVYNIKRLFLFTYSSFNGISFVSFFVLFCLKLIYTINYLPVTSQHSILIVLRTFVKLQKQR